MGTMGLRYLATPRDTFTLTLGRQPDFKNQMRMAPVHNMRIQYARKVSDRLSLGSEFEYSNPDHESSLKMGYEYLFRTGKVQGLLDTSGRVSCSAMDLQSQLSFSGMIDYYRNDYKFGVMMQYFPMPEQEQGPPPF